MEKWQKQLQEAKTQLDRVLLAQDPECELELLRIFCMYDLDPVVVEEAALHARTEDDWFEVAITRFPSIDTEQFRRQRAINVSKELFRLEQLGEQAMSGDRDQIILKHIIKEDNLVNHANSHLGELSPSAEVVFKNPLVDWAPTDKFRVAMVMLPAWGIIFPPYNIAKLVGMLREHGYSTKVYDLNIEAYHHILNNINEDYWRGERYFLWTVKENFYKYVFPLIKEMMHSIIDDLVASNPKVVGFSLYNTNIHAASYFIKELRQRLPNVCIVAGGPEVATTGMFKGPLAVLPVNYLFVGEAEESFLSTLENLPLAYPNAEFVGSTDSKLKLESYAFADYTDYDLKNYMHPDGVSIETSRGCVAQCSFCAETYFWKFRSITPDRVVDEMKHQIELHGVKRFWFVDSLVNGNLKNFERLVDLIIENELNISWNSYVRCDGRMTREFLHKVKLSGCTSLSYGVESGSQKVLHDMRKKIEIWEIENNLNDGVAEGIFNHVNWMIGFPTEEPIDFLHSLQLLANTRKSINIISPGFGAGPAAQSHMETNWKEYGIVSDNHIAEFKFLNNWYTHGYKNTILHRFIRIKLFHVWLEILKKDPTTLIINSQRYPNIKDFYRFNIRSKPSIKYVEYDNFVKLDRLSGDSLSDSITNEFFTLFYAMYLYFGEYNFDIAFDPTVDLPTFGDALVNDYRGNMRIDVDAEGNYKVHISHEFKCDEKGFNFSEEYSDLGNFKDWISSQNQTKDTVHEAYRKKSKVIPIQLTQN